MNNITGVLQAGLQDDEWQHLLTQMSQNGGTWWDREAGVGFAQQTNSGRPIASPSERYTLTFNGAIYNSKELRKELTKAGARFQGYTELETVLVALDHWGIEKTLDRVVGMFAFGVWDRKDRCLCIARDRAGEKPLYYGWGNRSEQHAENFFFASDVQALKSHPAWKGSLREEAIEFFAHSHYIPAPYSIYEGIYKLLPGTFLKISPQELCPKDFSPQDTPTAYWSITQDILPRFGGFAGTEGQAVEELRRILKNSIRAQMTNDTPCGAFLSGGVDSSLIVAMMQEISKKPIKTFSMSFQNHSKNTQSDARKVAEHLKTEHTEHILSAEDILECIPKIAGMHHEPFSDVSQFGAYFGSRVAREKVNTCLFPEGGDEIFGGHSRYIWGGPLSHATVLLPLHIRRGIAWALRRVNASRNPTQELEKLARLLELRDATQTYESLTSCWKTTVTRKDGRSQRLDHRIGPMGMPEKWMFLDLLYYLPDDVLARTDCAAMHFGLDARTPFLDHRLIEFAASLPMRFKIRNFTGKWILKELLASYLPTEWIHRRRSRFSVPLGTWLRGPLREWADSLLHPDHIKRAGFYDPVQVQKKWQEHLSGKRNWQFHLWNALVFHQWWLSQPTQPQKD